jgi:hypothetical protein
MPPRPRPSFFEKFGAPLKAMERPSCRPPRPSIFLTIARPATQKGTRKACRRPIPGQPPRLSIPTPAELGIDQPDLAQRAPNDARYLNMPEKTAEVIRTAGTCGGHAKIDGDGSSSSPTAPAAFPRLMAKRCRYQGRRDPAKDRPQRRRRRIGTRCGRYVSPRRKEGGTHGVAAAADEIS